MIIEVDDETSKFILIFGLYFTEHTIPECILVGKISINGLSDLQRLPKADKCGLFKFLKNILVTPMVPNFAS